MASTYLSRTTDASGNSDQKKWTLSAWVKRSGLGSTQMIMAGGAGSYYTHIYFRSDDKFAIYNHANNTSHNYEGVTTRTFEDVNSWYHIVVRSDTANATAEERCRVYVNGEQATLSANPGQNINYELTGQNMAVQIGVRLAPSTGDYFNGSMSHIHFCDEQSYAPTEFGSIDTTTGEWQINTSPSVTYGNHGFFILKDGNSVTDQSGQSHNFTVGAGTLTKTEDCPSNIMATLDVNSPTGGGFSGNSGTWANGNTKFTTSNSSSNFGVPLSTLGMNKGKYYAECKKISGNQGLIGIRGWQGTSTNNYLGDTITDYAIYTSGKMFTNNTDTDIGGSSYANNDIIGVFVDCDNWKIYFSKNGTIMNTTGHTITDITADTNARSLGAYFFGTTEWDSSGNGVWEWNFGNGAFSDAQLTGTTYNGANGKGIFKYDPNNITLDGVSKSFNALSTKGLNA